MTTLQLLRRVSFPLWLNLVLFSLEAKQDSGPLCVLSEGLVARTTVRWVNLSSRVQSATKRLRSSILITGETRRRIAGAIPSRRLATVRVRNILAPVDLCELLGGFDPRMIDITESNEHALERFEATDFRGALEILGPLVAYHPDDGPCMLLVERIIKGATIAPGEPFDPVCDLP